MKLFYHSFPRFIFIWIISTVINYSSFFLLYNIWVYYLFASITWYILWLFFGFYYNKSFTFSDNRKVNNLQYINYLIIYIFNLIVFTFIVYLLVDIYSIHIYISNILWLTYTTIANYLLIKKFVFKKKTISIAIGWNSWAWKTTIRNILINIIWKKHICILKGDSSHKWERNDKNWESITHLNPEANHLKQEILDIKQLKNWFSVLRKYYDHSIWKFTKTNTILPRNFIIYDWLHGLHYTLSPLFQLKIFIESETDQSKIRRDLTKRNWKYQALKKNIEKRKYDYKKYILPQKDQADIIIKRKENMIIIKINKKINYNMKILSRLWENNSIYTKNNRIFIKNDSNLKIYTKVLWILFNKEILYHLKK